MATLAEDISISSYYFDTSVSVPLEEIKNSTHVVETNEEFHKLETEWNELLQDSSANSIFLTWEWISTWWKHFSERSNLKVITVRCPCSNQLIGIAPLATKLIKNLAGINDLSLIFLGSGDTAPDHLDFIIRKGHESSVSSIITHKLSDEFGGLDQVKLSGVSENTSVLYKVLLNTPSLYRKVDRTVCPYLLLPDSWSVLKNGLSKTMRYNIGRFSRRLEKDYPNTVKFKKVTESRDVKPFMETLIALHTNSQKRKNNEGLFSNQKMIDFQIELAQLFHEKGWLRSYTLDVGETHIAAIHCFQYNGTVSFYQSGFDSFWQRYSPGTQIMAHAIKESIVEKNILFDFLRGEEEYKFNWTNSYSTDLSFTIPLKLRNKVGLKLVNFGRQFI